MLTLSDLHAGLRDLLGARRADLRKSKAGKYYEPMLQEQLASIEALPPALVGGAPLDAALDALDAEHDGYGGAIYFTTEAYLRLPGAKPEIVDAAARVRAGLIPSLFELGASYATEAERALERKPLLVSLADDLRRFPLAGGGTLLDTATAFLDAGARLHEMLGSRSGVPHGTAREASKIRAATVGMLGRLRVDVTREVQKNKKLPRDLDAKIFGMFDRLGVQDERKSRPPGPA
jgi:hypothetical protein